MKGEHCILEEDRQSIAEMVKHLKRPMYIVIVSHRNPDGDAVGASLALYHLLRGLGHTVQVILPSAFPAVFDWMPGASDVLIFDHDKQASVEKIEQADLVWMLDFNALDRIDRLGAIIAEKHKPIWVIDHHMDPEPFADIMISQPSASSTCELLYQWIVDAGWGHLMDETIGSCLQVGILTDTGGYRHATNQATYQISGALKQLGVNDALVYQRVMDTKTEKQLRILGLALSERMEVLPEHRAAIIALSRADYLKLDIQRGDTEGVVNYLLKMPGIDVAAFITEQPKMVKLSLRSRGDISVQRIATDHFNGGGHFNASGGHLVQPLKEVVDLFKKVLPNYV